MAVGRRQCCDRRMYRVGRLVENESAQNQTSRTYAICTLTAGVGGNYADNVPAADNR